MKPKNSKIYFISLSILAALVLGILVTFFLIKPSSSEQAKLATETLAPEEGVVDDGEDTAEHQKETQSSGQDEEAETHIPRYEVELEFFPDTALLQGTSKISVWNQAEQATDQVNVQVFMNAFREGREPPVLPQFLNKAFPLGIKHTEMVFTEVSVNEQPTAYELLHSALRIDLGQEWQTGQKLDILLEWQVKIPEIHHRVGRENDAFWFGNVLPILAVYDNDWHVYDYETVGEPFFSEISDYIVQLKTPTDYEVISTGSVNDIVEQSSKKITKIEAQNVREFAFALTSNHKQLSLESRSGKTVNLYYRLTAESHALDNLELAVDMLDYLEERIGEYPYDELHIFENHMFITGMEYPGIVFVQAERLMSATGHVTVLHEIAHQWFYNIVGNNQVFEPWLDEGFATYLTDEFLQGEKLESYYAAELNQFKRANPDLSIQAVQHFSDWSTYWRSNYRKSSFMLFELRKQMGEATFTQFIRTYYETYKFKIASTNDFIELAEQFIGHDLGAFFLEWGLTSNE